MNITDKTKALNSVFDAVLPEFGYKLKDLYVDIKSFTLTLEVNDGEKRKTELINALKDAGIVNSIRRVKYFDTTKLMKIKIFLSEEYCVDSKPLTSVKFYGKSKVLLQEDYDSLKNRIYSDDSIVNKKAELKKLLFTKPIKLKKRVKKKKTPSTKSLEDDYKSIRLLTLDEFLDEMQTSYKETGKISNRKKHWVYLIKNNLLECVVTKELVSYCSYDCKENKDTTTYHYNFYSEKGELFSIDHKTPIARGGSKTNNNNVQVMLMKPNNEKGCKLIYT